MVIKSRSVTAPPRRSASPCKRTSPLRFFHRVPHLLPRSPSHTPTPAVYLTVPVNTRVLKCWLRSLWGTPMPLVRTLNFLRAQFLFRFTLLNAKFSILFLVGDTIPLTLYFTSDTPEPTDTIFYLVATVSGHFTALPVHPNRRLSWSSSHQFPIRSFFHEDPTTLDITFDKPLELSVPLSALKLPSFRARHSVYNYTLDLQLMAKNFWSPQTAQDVFTFKIPITIVSAWSSLPSPKSYDGGQSVATPYFANRSVKQLTAHERDLGARREKDVFIVKERLEVGRYGSKWLPEDLPFGCCWQWLSKTRDVYTPTGCNSFTPFGCTIY
ncbi:hypothetical protein BC936DRAFT_145684 [Jimgerdemannia flammicorona]|uniref:Uncharacterized protein n=1 Tax=Jimgerdemannia flammicorona TaxID=994334 RepID=A0A433D9G8_9FUNG|nr:hypothetical protein BC936DRAFT_145684 [Jimgerdemannia flammicorona]